MAWEGASSVFRAIDLKRVGPRARQDGVEQGVFVAARILDIHGASTVALGIQPFVLAVIATSGLIVLQGGVVRKDRVVAVLASWDNARSCHGGPPPASL